MSIASRQIVVCNSMGLHARPAMRFVETANQFKSAVTVRRTTGDPCQADGKSVLQMMVLEAVQGTTLQIDAEGDDAEQAVAQLAKLFEDKFGEE